MMRVPQTTRYTPRIPCPWRHDITLKPIFTQCSVIDTRLVIDTQEEVNWLKNKWNINLQTVNRHILFDLDSWYLHAAGLYDFNLLVDRNKTEQAVQKMLKDGEKSLSEEERKLISDEYNKLDIHGVERMKLEQTGLTYWEELRNEPFHKRHNIVNNSVCTVPVDCVNFPNRYAALSAARRKYTKIENNILDILIQTPATEVN